MYCFVCKKETCAFAYAQTISGKIYKKTNANSCLGGLGQGGGVGGDEDQLFTVYSWTFGFCTKHTYYLLNKGHILLSNFTFPPTKKANGCRSNYLISTEKPN